MTRHDDHNIVDAEWKYAVGVIGPNIVIDCGTNDEAMRVSADWMDRLEQYLAKVAAQVDWPGLAHDLRTYARHDALCNYRPTYPDFPVATCDCGFDAVLDRYDRASAT